MDIQRSILIVALAIVSYMMVLQWNQDYGQAALPTEIAATSSTVPGLPDTTAATSTPAGSDDIPSATAVVEPSAISAAPAAASNAGAPGSAVSIAKANEDAGERFLKLLMTQIQNQDPLNPMDNAQMTTQMAQINTVAGIEKLNDSMT